MILYYKVAATTYGASEHFNRWRCDADSDVTPAVTWYRVHHQPCRVLEHVDAYSRIYSERCISDLKGWLEFAGLENDGVEQERTYTASNEKL